MLLFKCIMGAEIAEEEAYVTTVSYALENVRDPHCNVVHVTDYDRPDVFLLLCISLTRQRHW